MLIQLLKIDAILFIAIYIIWYCLVVLLPRFQQPVDYEQEALYHHYFMIPCLNEETVIADTISFWNKHIERNPKIRIFLINDASSDNTKQVIEENISGNPHYVLVNRVKPNAQTGKGDALNYAYNQIVEEVEERKLDPMQVIITIFDADAVVYDGYLEEVEANFALPEIALVQARVAILNKNKWLGLMQDIDFYTCVDGIQNLREKLGNVGAGGNGQSIRLSSIISEQNPWGQALLEDFEFSTRLLLQGYKTRHMHKQAVYQQGLDEYWPFVRQRARWAQGGIQCIKYINTIVDNEHLKWIAKLEMIYFMYLPFVSIIGVISYILLSSYLILTPHDEFTKMLFIILIASNFITGVVISIKYHYQTEESFHLRRFFYAIGIGCTIIFYDWCLVPCQIMAVYRQFKGSTNWVKTERTKMQLNNEGEL